MKTKKTKLRTRKIKPGDDPPKEMSDIGRAWFFLGRASRQLKELQDTLIALAEALGKL